MTKIVYLEDKYNSKWDDYIDRSSSGTFYHLLSWKHILERSFGFTPVYLMSISKTNTVSGVLPLFLMKDLLGKSYLISTPSADFTGVCADDNETGIALLDKAREIADDKKVQYMEIRQPDVKVYDLPSISDFISMRLNLADDEDVIWKDSLNTKARNQTRRAYKEGLTVDLGREYLEDFYNVYSTNMRDLGTPVYPKSFFRGILDEFKDSAGIIVVKLQGTVIGGMFFITYKRTFSDTWASSLKKHNKLCPNNILYWEAIKYACKNGFEYFDFGRSTINSGTYNFKRQWGAEPLQLYYLYYLNKSAIIPEVNADNNQYQMAIDIWKKLPLPLANALGPRLVKYFPEY